MANDIVSPKINAATPASLQPQPPHFGNVVDASGSPNLVVLWDTFSKTTLAAAALADTGLDVIEDPDANLAAAFRGKNVIPIAPSGATTLDPSGGTSRSFVGLVLAVYLRTPIQDAPGSGDPYLLMKSGDLYIEDLASRYVVIQGY